MQKSRGWQFVPAAFLVIAATMLVAAAPGSDNAPPARPQAADPPPGDLLIAAENMGDPRFSHAVILLLSHNADGAFGIVINRPLEEKPIADILAAAASSKGKKPDPGIGGTIRIFAGGPVQPELGFVVHTPDYKGEGTLTVPRVVAMTPTTDILRDIGHHKGPAKYFFALGYAGWGAGQLEAESSTTTGSRPQATGSSFSTTTAANCGNTRSNGGRRIYKRSASLASLAPHPHHPVATGW